MDESSIIFPSLMGQLKRNRYVSSDLNLVIVGYGIYSWIHICKWKDQSCEDLI